MLRLSGVSFYLNGGIYETSDSKDIELFYEHEDKGHGYIITVLEEDESSVEGADVYDSMNRPDLQSLAKEKGFTGNVGNASSERLREFLRELKTDDEQGKV